MKKPTAEQIKAEISALEGIKGKVPRKTFFGDDNHEAIEADIEVLKNNLSDEAIYDRSHTEDESDERHDDDSLWSEHAKDSALSARRWLDGDADESPSTGWKALVK